MFLCVEGLLCLSWSTCPGENPPPFPPPWGEHMHTCMRKGFPGLGIRGHRPQGSRTSSSKAPPTFPPHDSRGHGPPAWETYLYIQMYPHFDVTVSPADRPQHTNNLP